MTSLVDWLGSADHVVTGVFNLERHMSGRQRALGPFHLMLVVIVAFVPVTSLLTGTFFSPAVPFKDTAEVEEYQEMQKSYNSDSWLPPRLWTGTSSGDRDRDRD